MKIVIIGAGSTVFTPGLIADLTGSTLFSDATVALVDINPHSAETMARYAERVARERGVGLRVEYATDRREVLSGADFVTVTIAVGGVRAWEPMSVSPRRTASGKPSATASDRAGSSVRCATSRSSWPSPATWKSSARRPGSSTTPIRCGSRARRAQDEPDQMRGRPLPRRAAHALGHRPRPWFRAG